MIVLNDLYDYGPKIYQDTDYFKFSLDSLLLAEFTKYKDNDKILDMCTGNAPIPLILASKNDKLKIDAVEIRAEITNLAKKSVEENAYSDRIKIYNEDIKNFSNSYEYDVITCNPPYFKNTGGSEKNLNKVKRIARHEVELTLEEAIETAKKLLKSNGSLYLVQRVDRFLETCNLLERTNFGIRETVFVFTKKKKRAEFFLLEASKYKKSDLKVKSLYVEDLKTYKNIFKEERS